MAKFYKNKINAKENINKIIIKKKPSIGKVNKLDINRVKKSDTSRINKSSIGKIDKLGTSWKKKSSTSRINKLDIIKIDEPNISQIDKIKK